MFSDNSNTNEWKYILLLGMQADKTGISFPAVIHFLGKGNLVLSALFRMNEQNSSESS